MRSVEMGTGMGLAEDTDVPLVGLGDADEEPERS